MERDSAVEYYTPSIEEFCVGFEFQNLDFFPTEWKDDKVRKYHDLRDIDKWIDKGEIRVKILDHEDFTQLGFVPYHAEYLTYPYYMKVEGRFEYQIEHVEDNTYCVTLIDGVGINEKEYVLFFGRIRNKFELNKTLNQVKWTSETK